MAILKRVQGAGSSLDFGSFTAGAKRCLDVAIHSEETGATRQVQSVTMGGRTAVRASDGTNDSEFTAESAASITTDQWYFLEADIDAATDGVINITWDTAPTEMSIHATLMDEVHQGGGAATTPEINGASTGSSTPNPLTASITGKQDGDQILAFGGCGEATSSTWGSDFTKNTDSTGPSSTGCVADHISTGTGSITASCTWSTQNRAALSVVRFAAAPNVSVTNLSPADGAFDVNESGTDFVITFDRTDMQAGTGNLVLRKWSDDTAVETIAVGDTGKVTFSTNTCTISPSTTLDSQTRYYWEIASGVIESAAEGGWDGFAKGQWDFYTNGIFVDTTPGANKSFEVPAGVTTITVKKWAAGAGAGGSGTAGSGGVGGGGGFVAQDLAVTPEETLTYAVGSAGQGGLGTSNLSGQGGSAGGYSEIRRGLTRLGLVGSGGGGGGGDNSSATAGGAGGAGGGATGGTGGSSGLAGGGTGGTTSAAGSGGTGGLNDGAAGTTTTGGGGADGSDGGGTTGGGPAGGTPEGGAGGESDILAGVAGGGGGGSGRFGGGGGAASASGDAGGGGGGGGSNLTTGTNVTSTQASGQTGAGQADAHYPGGVGDGGSATAAGAGNDGGPGQPGAIVFLWESSQTVSPTSIGSAETFGSPALVQHTTFDGIASAEQFGLLQLGGAIQVDDGIASAEQFGGAQVVPASVMVSPTAIPSEEAFGTPEAPLDLELSAIASDEAVPSQFVSMTEQRATAFGDDDADPTTSTLATENADRPTRIGDVFSGRIQLAQTGYNPTMVGEWRYKKQGDPAVAWDTLDPEEFADPDFGTLQFYSRVRTQDILSLSAGRILSAEDRGALHNDFVGDPPSSGNEPLSVTQDGIPCFETGGSDQGLRGEPAADYDWMDNGTGGVDIFALVYVATVPTTQRGICGTGNNSSSSKGLRLRSRASADGDLDARWGNGTGIVTNCTSAADTMKPGWQLLHVAADSSFLTIYRNNVQVAQNSLGGTPAAGTPATALNLGRQAGITATMDADWAQFNGYYNAGGNALDATKRDAVYELFKQRYPILRLFDDSIGLFAAYQFNSPYPQTHVANGATRIQTLNSANGGAQLTGLITDFEPRLVTKDGYQWARILINGAEGTANDQGFQDVGSGAGTAYEPFYDGSAWACYFVCEPDQAGGTFFCTDTDFSSLGHILRFGSSGSLNLRVHNGTDQVVNISSPQAYAPGGLKVFAFRYNGSNLFEILVNNVVVASGAPLASFGSGSTGDDTVFFNDLTGGNMLAGHHLHMLLCTGVDHSQNGIGTEVYRGLRHHYKDLVFG